MLNKVAQRLRCSARSGIVVAATTTHVDTLLARYAPPCLRIAVIHSTPARREAEFREHLHWLAQHYEIVDPQMLLRFWNGDGTALPTRSAIVLTFDDGLRNNAEVAAPLLDSIGARAIFFVVPGFIKASRGAQYYRERFFPTESADTENDEIAMTVAQVKELARLGHMIGNHTYSHASLDQLSPELGRDEIRSARDAIVEWTGEPCHAFAWTFAWNRITRATYAFAKQYHPLVFSACPGANYLPMDKSLPLWRTTVEAWASEAERRFLYRGLGDLFWRRQRQALENMLTT